MRFLCPYNFQMHYAHDMLYVRKSVCTSNKLYVHIICVRAKKLLYGFKSSVWCLARKAGHGDDDNSNTDDDDSDDEDRANDSDSNSIGDSEEDDNHECDEDTTAKKEERRGTKEGQI